MNPINLNWIYLTGLKMAHSAVKKYREETIGVFKEELFKTPETVPETLYYIPGDKHTFLNESDFKSRIDALLKEAHLSRSLRFPSKPVLELGTFKFVHTQFIFEHLGSLMHESDQFYFAKDNISYPTADEAIINHPILNTYYTNGKLVFRY